MGTVSALSARARRALGAAFVALALVGFAAPLHAQEPLVLPDAAAQEILIKTALASFNDANATGNYSVFHAKLAAPFRDQFSPDRLAEVFKAFAEGKIMIEAVLAGKPVLSEEARVDDRGVLLLHGYFDVSEQRRVSFVLDYLMSEGAWKLIKIAVDVGLPRPAEPAGEPAPQ